jgi:hypothetical protein
MTAPHSPQWLRDVVAAIGAQWLNKDVSASEAEDLIADAIQEHHDSGDPYGRTLWLTQARRERLGWWNKVKEREGEREAEALLSGVTQEALFDLPFPLLGGEVSVGFGRMVRQLDLDYAAALLARQVRARQQDNTNAAHEVYLAEMDRLLKVLDQDHGKKLLDFIEDPGHEEEGTG